MHKHKFPYLTLIFAVPLILGIAILGFWYLTVRIEKKPLLPDYGSVPSFNLITEENKPFSREELTDKVTIVDFIFTECAGACPVMSMKMSALQDTFRSDPKLHFLSFSVDPATDSPAVLSTYARNHQAIPGKWTFLTGQKNAIYSLTKDGFHLGVDMEGEDAILHSQKFVIVDYEGKIRGYYDSDDDSAMRDLVRDARILLARLSG